MEIGHTVADRLALFHQAEGAVLARRVVANQNLFFAVGPSEAHGTDASIRSDLVHANAAILAGSRLAFVNVVAAESAVPAGGAIARKLEASALHALSSIVALIATSCKIR